MEFMYPVRDLSAFIIDSKLFGFSSPDSGNYTHIINTPKFIYVVSNRTELLKLSKSSWRVISKVSFKMQCPREDYCDQININFVELNKEKGILWYCFALKVMSNNAYQEGSPYCYLPYEESLDKRLGQWNAQTYTSSDFYHNTVTITVPNFIYSGLYFADKQLHIYKNPLSFSNVAVFSNVIGLPTDFIKGPGDFIYSFKYESSIYFLLLETDFSCGFWSPILQTRLLRICDDDIGGSNKQFTALAKINVNCEHKSNNPNVPSYIFRLASSASWMPNTGQLAISFMNRIYEPLSAVLCLYSINSINDAFNSDFKKSVEKPNYYQNVFKNTCQNFSKNSENAEYLSNIYVFSKTYPLRRKILTNSSFFIEIGAKIQHISSDETILSKGQRVVLFLGIEYKDQSAIIIMSIEPLICISEKFLTLEKITTLTFINDEKPTIYIGTSHRLIVLPIDRCKIYLSEDICNLNLYCEWNSYFKICILISEHKLVTKSKITCPQISKDYEDLNLKLGLSCGLFAVYDLQNQIGVCTCQKVNSKDNKISVTVSNYCKIDGGWSPFSEWSDCSVTCNGGYQSRFRSCDNPLPQNNGNPCNGKNTELRPCTTKIECIKISDNEIESFSGWSKWSTCSKSCGISYKLRTRYCILGNCKAPSTESKLCLVSLCKGVITSEWSVWSIFNPSESLSKRFRFICSHSYLYEPSSLTIKSIKLKNNISSNCDDDECFIKNGESILSEKWMQWSLWSTCSRSCGIGISSRSRKCTDNHCLGPTYEFSKCNVHPCKSVWSCWSEWKGCSLDCETPKIKTRYRYCLKDNFNNPCVGSDKEEKECTLIVCTNSYTQWSLWSSCTQDGVIVRTRKCKSKRICLFSLMQSKPCARSSINKPVLYYSSIYMIVSGLLGLLAGVIIGAIICYVWWRCTISVIQSAHSGSLRLSNPNQLDDVYNSQSLNTMPDTISSIQRQRSSSNNDNYFTGQYLSQYRDDREPYGYHASPSFVDNSISYSAFRQPLPEVLEN